MFYNAIQTIVRLLIQYFVIEVVVHSLSERQCTRFVIVNRRRHDEGCRYFVFILDSSVSSGFILHRLLFFIVGVVRLLVVCSSNIYSLSWVLWRCGGSL